MKKKYALCVGINDYAGSGNDLQGCVNDALGWSGLLRAEGYEVVLLTDADATKNNVVSTLTALIAKARLGDRVVFTYSGHGSWVPDMNGDEPDSRDEVLCLYDFLEGGLLVDDEMYSIFQARRFGVRATVISDSCHSGTVARLGGTWSGEQARYMPPVTFLRGPALSKAAFDGVLTKKASGKPRPATILMSGCDDTEFSYDAFIDGKPQGAFSAYAIRSWRSGDSYAMWYDKIRRVLPSGQYPQAPQLQGTTWQKMVGTL